jgi:hypothetical protein
MGLAFLSILVESSDLGSPMCGLAHKLGSPTRLKNSLLHLLEALIKVAPF